MLDERQTPFCWSTKHKLYILMCFSFGALSLKVYVNCKTFVNDDAGKTLTFHFVDGYIIKNGFAYAFYVYLIYLYSIFYVFPVYIAYICICLNITITTLQCHSSKMKGGGHDLINIFGMFTNNTTISYLSWRKLMKPTEWILAGILQC